MTHEIDAIRALLTSKPRPVGWAERRARIDEVGSVWPVAGDIKLEAVGRSTARRTPPVAGRGHFHAHNIGMRLEAGYRFGNRFAGFTPYAAAQAQIFRTPSYSETATSGSSQFALSYDAKTTTATRTELGYWLDSTVPLAHGAALSWRGRVAWANDSGDRKAAATFQALPGASFHGAGRDAADQPGAAQRRHGAAAEQRVSLGARFDGEVSTRSQTYGGTGTVRDVW